MGGSPPLPSHFSSLLAWAKDPRVLAVMGALTLRALERLGDEALTTIVGIAIGAPITRGAMAALKRLKSK